MLVQLRRVVYLLVLLQCCTCVVHAYNGRFFTDLHNPYAMEAKLGSLKTTMDERYREVGNALSVLKGGEDSCNKYSKRLKDAEDHVNTVLGEINGAKETDSVLSPSESDRLFKKAWDAKDETFLAVTYAKSAVERVIKASQKYKNAASSLIYAAENLLRNAEKYLDATKLRNDLWDKDRELIKVAEGYKTSATEIVNFSTVVLRSASGALTLAQNVTVQVSAAENAVKQLNDFIYHYDDDDQLYDEEEKEEEEEEEGLTLVQTPGGESEAAPAVKEEKQPQKEEQQKAPAEPATDGMSQPAATDKGDNTSDQIHEDTTSAVLKKPEKQTLNNQHNNTAEDATGSDTTAQVQQNNQGSEETKNMGSQHEAVITGKPKEEEHHAETNEKGQKAEVLESQEVLKKPEKSKSPQKLKETMNTSSATKNFQPHHLPSGSLSSGSLHPVITRLSDSSNSPALLHGPLLLLALLCVLGCTGVF